VVTGTTSPAGPEAAPEADDALDDALCEVALVHEDRVRSARAARADDSEMEALAETFQVLASPTRLRLIEALARGEMCVCDLAAVAGVSQSAVSHHLRTMRALRLVRYRKESRMAYYRLDDAHIEAVFRMGLEHVRE
jgi:ArsR family transcriptional regulator, lead/cadmium/zinc/bismuth-responsive transcriptional repressor